MQQRSLPADFTAFVSNDERRVHQRLRCRLNAFIHCHGRFQPVVITNVSVGGCGIKGAFGLIAGDRVEVELLSKRRLPGRIAWAVAGHVGIAFDALLPHYDGLLADAARLA